MREAASMVVVYAVIQKLFCSMLAVAQLKFGREAGTILRAPSPEVRIFSLTKAPK